MKFKYLLALALLLVSCAPKESQFKVEKKNIEPEVVYKPKNGIAKKVL